MRSEEEMVGLLFEAAKAHERIHAVSMALDMDAYAEKYSDKAIRKNLTIPAWLNTFAEKQHISFSKVLQESLIEMYRQHS